jgi:GTP-binding protein HflX
VLAADLILHVRDISHAATEEQAKDVREILNSLGVTETTPLLEIWNKVDVMDPEAREAAQARADRDDAVFATSALTGDGLDLMLAAVNRTLDGDRREETVHLAFNEGRKRSWLFDKALVEKETQDDTGYTLLVRWSAKDARQFESL